MRSTVGLLLMVAGIGLIYLALSSGSTSKPAADKPVSTPGGAGKSGLGPDGKASGGGGGGGGKSF